LGAPNEVKLEQLELLPFWSEALLEPEREQEAPPLESPPASPIVVTFYSFRGGVGRSTALGITAGLLARQNYRVVIVDLDLEAPGISFLLIGDAQSDEAKSKDGVLDFLYQRSLTPQTNTPDLNDCVVPLSYKGPGRGEVFLIQAGSLDDEYVHKLADLSWHRLYKTDPNPVDEFLNAIKQELNPDAILIDSRTGFAEEGAVSLMSLADACVICLSPNLQNLAGLEIVLKALSKTKAATGRPNVKFLLSPLAAVPAGVRRSWISHFENWLQDTFVLEKGQVVEDLYSTVSYNPNILTLASLLNDVPPELAESYRPLAEFIATGLPSKELLTANVQSLGLQGKVILQELLNQSFPSAAQDISADQLPDLFQRTGDFPKFLRKTTSLTLGAKGTGKSVLFRLFVETANEAKHLAGPDASLQQTRFLPVHGKPTTSPIILTSSDFKAFAKRSGGKGPDWQAFWVAYAVLTLSYQLRSELPEEIVASPLPAIFSQAVIPHTQIVDWLSRFASTSDAVTIGADVLRRIDNWLKEQQQSVWLFYDELDVAFDSQDRNPALVALLEWWLESGVGFSRLLPKILLRGDIWENLTFTNKSHYFSKLITLEWEEEDLWRLALRRTMRASRTLAKVINTRFGATVENLDNLSLGQLRDATGVLWGSRMGKGQKAYSYNWVRTRISDARGDAFPRSLGLLLETAIQRENRYAQPYSDDCLIRPRALIDSIDDVSAQRVAEVMAEYPDLREELEALRDERSPIEFSRLGQLWDHQGPALSDKISLAIQAGVFEDRTAKDAVNDKVYAVAELYLYGLGMKRKGQK
jgi:MinD-like ATPase involved in chromosome partitioning or flagellar assembly